LGLSGRRLLEKPAQVRDVLLERGHLALLLLNDGRKARLDVALDSLRQARRRGYLGALD
jgi:hypothetical protein